MGSPHRDTEGPARRAPAAAPEHRRGRRGRLAGRGIRGAHLRPATAGCLEKWEKVGKTREKRHVLGGKAMDLGVSVNVCVYVSIFLSYVSNLSV